MATAIQRTFFAPREFPSSQVRAVIEKFLDHEAETQAPLHADDPIIGGSSVGVTGPVIDSFVVVELLVELEPICPFPLPDSLVRPGGYDCVDEVVEDLLPKLESKWQQSNGKENP